ncbi:hypothetical protein BKA66DRAFT_572194 [Pyrenochaeta sp. MPI-SDFR-AT-0127]|nr:hypothetical protein BKA66DRAFT_572194 [Pyrenochaeta sp. MPI-SDFR-AT-0127]
MQLNPLLWSMMITSVTSMTSICGTHSPTREQIQFARNLQLHEMDVRSLGSSLANETGINIDIYYHVIADAKSEQNGFVAPSALTHQTKVLNDAYRPHNISWRQAGVDWSIAPDWTSNQAELAMKKFLRKGTYADLNIYIFPSIDYYHSAAFPKWVIVMGIVDAFPSAVMPQSEAWFQDAVLLRSDVLPGGTSSFNQGNTLYSADPPTSVYHTFEGGCRGDGDGIDDTPAESDRVASSGIRGCDHGRDSCIGPGFDPVTNYMDYSEETCYNEFTHGQEVRMYSQWVQFRAPHRSYEAL